MVSFGRLLGPVREMHTFAFGERSVGCDRHDFGCGVLVGVLTFSQQQNRQ